MLHVTLLAVGKLKEKAFAMACAEYLKRLGAFCRPAVIEVEEHRLPANPSAAEITACIAAEERRILDKLSPKDHVVALCIEGRRLDSPALAGHLEAVSRECSSLVFVIGGSHGLGDALKQRANLRLSMGPMTFPHQLARVMLLEQVYRSFAINNHLKYHK